ncbi:glycosyltransferase [Lachnospiraceae bacterium ZAX-1]
MEQLDLLQENIKYLKKKEFYYGPKLENLKYVDKAVNMPALQNGQLEQINAQHTVLISNEQDIGTILMLEDRSDRTCGLWGGKGKIEEMLIIPFYLYYDREDFEYLVSTRSLKEICSIFRIVVIVGEEALEEFFDHMDVLFPSAILGVGSEKINLKVGRLFLKYHEIREEMQAQVQAYYGEHRGDIAERILNDTAKIAVLKDVHDGGDSGHYRFSRAYRALDDSLTRKGYTVVRYEERNSIFNTPEITNIFYDRPDIVIQINKSRDGRTYVGTECIHLNGMENLVFINWLQDVVLDFLGKSYIASLGSRDYIFSYAEKSYLKQYGFSDNKVIYGGNQPIEDQCFCFHDLNDEEHGMYDCDIAFVGYLPPTRVIMYQLLEGLEGRLSIEQVGRLLQVAEEQLILLYDKTTGEYLTEVFVAERYTELLAKEFGCSEELKEVIYNRLLILNWLIARRLIMEQLAGQNKYKVLSYGNYDTGIPGIQWGGCIKDPAELSKAYQCAKMTVQINPRTTYNQRIGEALLSHTMVMVLQVDERDDMAPVGRYFKEKEGICYFKTKQELLHKIDFYLMHEEKRLEAIRKGNRKAKECLTADAIYHTLMEGLKEKIKTEGDR